MSYALLPGAPQKNVRAVRKERLHHPSVLGLTGEDAKTIDAEIEIDADYVICDESSMIDAPLFLQLVSAVARSGASLLLVGDANQLPPVGVGLPFKDLLNSEKVPATILTRLYRQASESQINTNAVKILSGVTFFGEPNGLMFDRTKQDFFSSILPT